GPAPLIPLTPRIGRPEKSPTQTATVNPPVTATAQLSVKWRLVPVFAAAGNGKSSGVSVPKPGIRATGSLRMSRTSAAAPGDMKRRPLSGAARAGPNGAWPGAQAAPVNRTAAAGASGAAPSPAPSPAPRLHPGRSPGVVASST